MKMHQRIVGDKGNSRGFGNKGLVYYYEDKKGLDKGGERGN
jgi:hypothetical protein